jgi:hypothetical protein
MRHSLRVHLTKYTKWMAVSLYLSLILWRIAPLLGKDLETNETTDIAMQRRSKHITRTVELLLETFSTRSVQRGYKEDNWGDPVS